MDENGDGRVSIREVKTASKRLGIEFSTDQLKKMMGELDENCKLDYIYYYNSYILTSYTAVSVRTLLY